MFIFAGLQRAISPRAKIFAQAGPARRAAMLHSSRLHRRRRRLRQPYMHSRLQGLPLHIMHFYCAALASRRAFLIDIEGNYAGPINARSLHISAHFRPADDFAHYGKQATLIVMGICPRMKIFELRRFLLARVYILRGLCRVRHYRHMMLYFDGRRRARRKPAPGAGGFGAAFTIYSR